MIFTEEEIERFWSKVDIRGLDECWEWLGSLTDRGYGRFGWRKKTLRSHRVSFILKNEIINKPVICHKCDNPKCVNPNHLFEGTLSDNSIDRERKGRGFKNAGSLHPMAKLNEQKVIEIKQKLNNGIGVEQLAREIGVSGATISNIKNHKSWRHVNA